QQALADKRRIATQRRGVRGELILRNAFLCELRVSAVNSSFAVEFSPMIKAILTDIEGTTSSLSFVKDVLFPYARARIADFVRAHANDGAVRAQLDEVSRIAGKPLADAQAIEQLVRWIDEDKKIAPLKTLQGM